MTNRLERGLCLRCATPLIAIEKALCSQCTKWYHEKATMIFEGIKREKVPGIDRKPSMRIKGKFK